MRLLDQPHGYISILAEDIVYQTHSCVKTLGKLPEGSDHVLQTELGESEALLYPRREIVRMAKLCEQGERECRL